MPALDLFEGFFIVEHPTFRRVAEVITSAAVAAGSAQPSALQAALGSAFAEGVLQQKNDLIGGVLLALIQITGSNHFAVHADRSGSGFVTRFQPLNASNPNKARSALENLPEVLLIKSRLKDKVAPGGRMKPPSKRY